MGSRRYFDTQIDSMRRRSGRKSGFLVLSTLKPVNDMQATEGSVSTRRYLMLAITIVFLSFGLFYAIF